MKVVIIGGVAGGASAAARLRRLDEHAEIVMLDKGPYISFANCGLPYYIGGEIAQRESLLLQTPESFTARFGVDVRVNTEAVAVHPQRHVVQTKGPSGALQEESYDKLVLAPGASPVVPPLPGVALPGIFTLRNVPDTDAVKAFVEQHQPAKAVVVGCGFIGLEMAEALVHRGVEVTAVDLARHALASIDEDMAGEVHEQLLQHGVSLRMGAAVEHFTQQNGGLAVHLQGGETLPCGMVVLAVGVRPDTAFLQNSGIALDEKGYIRVDDHLRTSDADIYAAGDAVAVRNSVTGLPDHIPLAGPANRQGRIVADNLAGLGTTYAGAQGSAIIKLFDMTVASTGLSEKGAKAAGVDYDKVFITAGSHAGYYPGATPTSIKALYAPATGVLLGAQLVGREGVDKRADVLATAIRAKMTADDLAELDLCYAPPYSAPKDPVNIVGYVIQNKMRGRVKQFHWQDVCALPRDGSVTLLDVRTEAEHKAGHIEGFANIPLNQLRARLHELPKEKPVYVHCESGLRSNVAANMLAQKGYQVYDLAGGWRRYKYAGGPCAGPQASAGACTPPSDAQS